MKQKKCSGASWSRRERRELGKGKFFPGASGEIATSSRDLLTSVCCYLLWTAISERRVETARLNPHIISRDISWPSGNFPTFQRRHLRRNEGQSSNLDMEEEKERRKPAWALPGKRPLLRRKNGPQIWSGEYLWKFRPTSYSISKYLYILTLLELVWSSKAFRFVYHQKSGSLPADRCTLWCARIWRSRT